MLCSVLFCTVKRDARLIMKSHLLDYFVPFLSRYTQSLLTSTACNGHGSHIIYPINHLSFYFMKIYLTPQILFLFIALNNSNPW